MQSLTFAQSTTNDQLNVGIVRRVDSPFDLFLNFEQLIDYKKRYIYFFVQSTGKRKVIMWGVFDKEEDLFIVENGCRYKPVQLQKIVRKWREDGYKHAGATVTDKFTSRILHHMGVETWTYEQYVDQKRFLAYLNDQIEFDDMEEEYGFNFLYEFLPPNVDPTDSREIDNYRETLEDEIRKYEKIINYTETDGELMRLLAPPIRKLLEEITREFDKQIQDKAYSEESYEAILGHCPDVETCGIGNDELCSVYSYGQPGDLYGEDPDLLL